MKTSNFCSVIANRSVLSSPRIKHPFCITNLLLCLASALWLPACGSGNAGTTTTAAPPTPSQPQAAITVSLSPNGAQMIDQGQTAQFTATVANDPANKGVSWTLSQNGSACSPGCGTIAPATTASGTATTYTAPASVSAGLQLSVAAVSVADATKSGSDTATVQPPPAISNPAQLPDATAGQPYSYQLTETGGVPPYTWSVASGSLPTGLQLDGSTGIISGTPGTTAAAVKAAGRSTKAHPILRFPAMFKVMVVDSGSPRLSNTQSLNINVVGVVPTATHFAVSAPSSATPGTALSFTVTALDASNSVVPSYTGTVHFTSSDAQAALPADYTFTAVDAGMHTFSATLNTAGSQTITATDAASSSITGISGAVTVAAPALQINLSSSGNFNMQRSTNTNLSNSPTFNIPAVLTASGGTAPYTWTATGLPDNTFSISNVSGDGSISTTGPFQIGNFTAVVTVNDSKGNSASTKLPLTVGCVLADLSNTGGGGTHNNNGALVGNYAYLVSGFHAFVGQDPKSPMFTPVPFSSAGSFTATNQGLQVDPNTLLGVIADGVADNTLGSNSSIKQQNSRFCIDLDGTGTLVLNGETYRIRGAIGVLSGGSAPQVHIIEVDSGAALSGELRLQDPATQFGTGDYVFGLSGRDTEYGPVSVAGDFAINNLQPPGGSAANGEADFNDSTLFGAAGTGNVKYNSIQVTFSADPFNSNFSRYTGSIKATTDTSIPEIDFAAYLVPGFVYPGRLTNKATDLFVVVTNQFGPTTGIEFQFIASMSGKIHMQNLSQPLGNSALTNQEAVYYRVGAVPPDLSPTNPVFNTGTAATVGSVFFDGQFSEFSEDSDVAGTVSSTGIVKFADTSQVSSTGRVTSGSNGPAKGYLWDKAMGIWFDGSVNADIGELSPMTGLIFQETGQVNSCQGPGAFTGTLAFNIPTSAGQSPVGVGLVSGGLFGCPNPPATNFGLTGDINSLVSGIQFGVQTGQAGTLSGLLFTISDVNGVGAGLNRFTVGDCPDSSNTGQPCFIGYGFGGLFSQILIETNIGLNDPSGFSPGPNKYPVVVVW